jgi:hypothetical protein
MRGDVPQAAGLSHRARYRRVHNVSGKPGKFVQLQFPLARGELIASQRKYCYLMFLAY